MTFRNLTLSAGGAVYYPRVMNTNGRQELVRWRKDALPCAHPGDVYRLERTRHIMRAFDSRTDYRSREHCRSTAEVHQSLTRLSGTGPRNQMWTAA